MSRPKKIRHEQDNLRAHIPQDEGDAWMAPMLRQSFINDLRADPFNGEPVACVLSSVMLDRATDSEREVVGELFTNALATMTAEQLAAFFRRVEKLKSNAEQPHRNCYAYFAYSGFIEETGREPSKPELRKYIMARPEAFPAMPPGDDKKAWTRLWLDSGLASLAEG